VDELGRAALDVAGIAQLVVSRAGVLASANSAARTLLGVSVEHLGRPFNELEVSFRPTSLRDAVDEVLRERREVAVGRTTLRVDGGAERRLEVGVSPLLSGDLSLGASIMFEDVTRLDTLREEIAGNRRDLELAYEELQSTIDELETTNEELQSANEELQTTNEELQSTNEELETINEELQSTNEELETINDELRERTTELNKVNDLFEAILTSLGVGVAVLDAHGAVQVWSRRAEDLWGVRQAEVAQQHFMALDIGLPVERLAPALRQILGGVTDREDLVLESVNRRGRSFACRTTVMPLAGPDASSGPGGAVVMMAEAEAEAEAEA